MLKLAKSPNNEITLSNVVAVNAQDHERILRKSKYVRLNQKYDFRVVASDGMTTGNIGLGGLQREWVKCEIGNQISVSPVSYENDLSSYLYQISVELSFYPRDPRKVPLPYDSDQLAKMFMETYIDNPFTRGQEFVIQPDEKKSQLLRARVLDLTGTNPEMLTDPDLLNKGAGAKGKKRDAGVLRHHTIVKFEKAQNTVLHLTGSCKGSSAPASIINPDFDFSAMGIGGLDKEFSTIFRRAFVSRVLPVEMVEKLGVKHVKGMLLHGPPGTGKTLLARQISKMLNARELNIVNGPEILNKFVGESEANIRKLFAKAEEEQTKMGSASGLHIIIFDEIDAICKERGTVGGGTGVHDTVVNQLLAKIDGVEQLNNVLLIGMTNRRDLIDDALLRPGRLEVQVEIGLPDKDGRLDILNIHTAELRKNKALDPAVDFHYLVDRTRNFSGAEIEGLVRSAVSTAVNRLTKIKDGISMDVKQIENMKVTKDDFEQALLDVEPAFGVSKEQLESYIGNGIIRWSPIIEQILDRGRTTIRQCEHDSYTTLISLLIHGKRGCGKTALAAQLAQECSFPFVKILTPKHLINYHESRKSQAIKAVFDDAYKSPLSCIILDGIDRLLDYVNIGPRFSNNVLQTLEVLVNEPPPHGHKLLIIGTTSHYDVLKTMSIADSFSYQVHVPYLDDVSQVLVVLKELDRFNEAQIKTIKKSTSHIKDLSIGVKKLMNIVGASFQNPDVAAELVFPSMLEEEGCNKFSL